MSQSQSATPRDRLQAWLTTLAYSMTNEGAELSDKDCAELHALLAASERSEPMYHGQALSTVIEHTIRRLNSEHETLTKAMGRDPDRYASTYSEVAAVLLFLNECAPSNPVSATEGPTREQVEALRFAGKYFEGFGFSHIQHGHSWTGAGLSEALQMLEQRLLRQATPVSPDGLDETDRRINARITLEDRASGKDNAAERGT